MGGGKKKKKGLPCFHALGKGKKRKGHPPTSPTVIGREGEKEGSRGPVNLEFEGGGKKKRG